MTQKVLVPIADGTEEIEAVTIIDVLRRAGAEVCVASVDGLQITASRRVKIVADGLIDAYQDQIFDLIALPGGMPGAEHLKDSAVLKQMLQHQYADGRWYAAICAAPAIVLEPLGLLRNCKATCHPNFKDRLSEPAAAGNRVVMDGNCITSMGPGTALEFALKLVEVLFGPAKRDLVAAPMVMAGL